MTSPLVSEEDFLKNRRVQALAAHGSTASPLAGGAPKLDGPPVQRPFPLMREHPVAAPPRQQWQQPPEEAAAQPIVQQPEAIADVPRPNPLPRTGRLFNTEEVAHVVVEILKLFVVSWALVSFDLERTWPLFGILFCTRFFFFLSQNVALRANHSAPAARRTDDAENRLPPPERTMLQRCLYRTRMCVSMYFVSMSPFYRNRGLEAQLAADNMQIRVRA